MGLLPNPEVLEKLYKLYSHNFDQKLPAQKRAWFLNVSLADKITHSLAHFIKVLPFEEYSYKVLPPILPQPLALHIQGSVYPPPFEGLPNIRSKLHPCFVFQSASLYAAEILTTPGVNSPDESILAGIAKIFSVSAGCTQKSWLGPPEDEVKYSMRSLVRYRPDTPGTITHTQGVSNTQKKDTILFSALNLAGKSIFTPPRFFLSAVTQLPYKEIWGEGGVQNLRNFFEKCSER